jgi:hypothetical protein
MTRNHRDLVRAGLERDALWLQRTGYSIEEGLGSENIVSRNYEYLQNGIRESRDSYSRGVPETRSLGHIRL